VLILSALIISSCSYLINNSSPEFDGENALKLVEKQLTFGNRAVGETGHRKVGDWIGDELVENGWEVEFQELNYKGKPIRNIIGKYGSGDPWLIIGAHYDNRLIADNDPLIANRNKPVPGANDGGSGVAVLLEISRIIPKMAKNNQLKFANIWLVFFDAEDNGNIPGWEWSLGSQAFVENLRTYPDAVVVVDMIGDRDLNICFEGNSNLNLLRSIWAMANDLGYGKYFDNERICYILDDHTAFLKAGIPSVDIIDIDYDYWHTIDDTLDKVSAESLQVIGDTLINWMIRK